MAKRRTNPADLKPMPWRDFALGFQLAMKAIETMKAPGVPAPFVGNPASLPDAPRSQIDTDPYLRVMFVMQQQFGRDYPHLGSFGYRFWGLLELVRSGQVEPYVTRDAEDGRVQGIHPALILSTAEVKLNKNGRLPLRRLLEQTDRIMRTEVAEAVADEPSPRATPSVAEDSPDDTAEPSTER